MSTPEQPKKRAPRKKAVAAETAAETTAPVVAPADVEQAGDPVDPQVAAEATAPVVAPDDLPTPPGTPTVRSQP